MKYTKKIVRIFFIACIACIYSGTGDAGMFDEEYIARLTDYKNRVQIKSSDGIVWDDVSSSNMKLYENDRIRTMDGSTAVATYDHKSNLLIKENSLVVIKKMISEPKLKTTKVELTNGSVTGKVKGDAEEEVVMMISSKPSNEETLIEIDSRKSADKPSEVTIDMSPNKDIEVRVKSGNASVSSKGETVELKDDESTIIKRDAAPLPPISTKKGMFNELTVIMLVFFGMFVFAGGIIVFKNR